MRYKATVVYDGTNYNGWQIQPNGETIQNQIQQALYNLTQQNIHITGAGRTDKGVHAVEQVFHFDCDKVFLNFERAINSQLPDDIYVSSCLRVPDSFHARYDAKWKFYSYMVNTAAYNPLQRNYAYQLCEPLDVEKMRTASKVFVGEHDFTSFNATKLFEISDQVRTIYSIDITENNGIISFDIIGNGFLRHMVRMIVGTLIEVGKGKLSIEEIEDMLVQEDKETVHYNAPACGLYLIKIGYDED